MFGAEPPEEELVARFRKDRDADAFAALYRRERSRVYSICLRFLREPSESEDLCHMTFLRAWEHHDELRGNSFGPWIRGIAANLARNRLRDQRLRERRLREAVVPLAPRSEGPEAERRSAARDEVRRAAGILVRLAAEDRRVFLLRHVDGQDHEEIAKRTGLAQDRVRVVLQRARRAFLRAWEEEAPASRAGAMQRGRSA